MNVLRLLAHERGFEGSFGDPETDAGPAARRILYLHRNGEEPGYLPPRRVGRNARRPSLPLPGDGRAAGAVPGDERPGHPLRVRPAGTRDPEPGAAAAGRDRSRP